MYPRTFVYDESNGLALGQENLDNNFYGVGNEIDYLYESAGTNKVPGRNYGFDYDGHTWSHTYESNSGRMDIVTAQGSSYDIAFNYGYDSDSNHVSSIIGDDEDTVPNDDIVEQFRYYETWRENYAGTHTKWNGSSRADYTAPNLTWQYQLRNYKLKGTSVNGSELSDKFGSASSDITYSMTYDSRRHLKTWDTSRVGGVDSSYTWDSAGNPENYDGQGYSANGLNEIQPTSPSDSYTYDDDGNLTADGVWTYTYDANNRIATMSKTGKYLEFYYDYMGRRVEKKVWNSTTPSGNPNVHLKFVYQGMTLIAELNSSGTIQKSFHWGLDKSDTHGGAGGAMGLLMMKIHSGTHAGEYYPAYDMNGNVTGMLDSGGAFEAWYEYDGFGKIVTEGGVTTSGSNFKDVNPIRFSTQYTDEETGLVYYGLRYYDPSKGRFINRDPIGEQGGLNLYRIVGNNPVSRVDIWGLKDEGDDDDQRDCDKEPGMEWFNGQCHEIDQDAQKLAGALNELLGSRGFSFGVTGHVNYEGNNITWEVTWTASRENVQSLADSLGGAQGDDFYDDFLDLGDNYFDADVSADSSGAGDDIDDWASQRDSAADFVDKVSSKWDQQRRLTQSRLRKKGGKTNAHAAVQKGQSEAATYILWAGGTVGTAGIGSGINTAFQTGRAANWAWNAKKFSRFGSYKAYEGVLNSGNAILSNLPSVVSGNATSVFGKTALSGLAGAGLFDGFFTPLEGPAGVTGVPVYDFWNGIGTAISTGYMSLDN